MNPWQRFKQSFHVRYSAWLLQGLSRITFWSNKFKQRLSPLGLGVAAAILLTLVFGANIKLSSIYQLFSLLSALLITALLVVWIKSKWVRPAIHAQRILPKFITVGEQAFYRIAMHNKAEKTFYHINISEVNSLPKPSLFQFLNSQEPLEHERNWYDRHTGFYRFVWLQNILRGAVFMPKTIAALKAGETQDCKMSITPLRRGFIHLSALRVRFPEPLGLAYSFVHIPQQDSLLALPKAYRLPQHILQGGKRSYQQGGVSQASHIGDSEEFSRLREYRDGDSPRHMFWPSLARASQPLVKEYQDEYFSRSALILDNFVGQNKQVLFEEAVSVAAGFSLQSDTQNMLLDLMFVGEDKHQEHTLVGRSLAHAEQMLETLACVQLCDADFNTLSQAVLSQKERISGCVLILLAWDKDRQALVQQLQALSIPTQVFLLLSDGEAAPQADVFVLRQGYIQQDLDSIE